MSEFGHREMVNRRVVRAREVSESGHYGGFAGASFCVAAGCRFTLSSCQGARESHETVSEFGHYDVRTALRGTQQGGQACGDEIDRDLSPLCSRWCPNSDTRANREEQTRGGRTARHACELQAIEEDGRACVRCACLEK